MRVTLKDIAQAVGVSPMAVSRVLNGRGGTVRVSEARAAQIRRAAAEMGYRPNAIARSLRLRRTNTIALVWEGTPYFAPSQSYMSSVLGGAVSVAFGHGYHLTLYGTANFENDRRALDDGRFDALVLIGSSAEALAQHDLGAAGFPVVLMHSPPLNTTLAKNIVRVGWDNAQACTQLVSHLVDLGHRRLAFVQGTLNSNAVDSVIRKNEVQRQVAQLGLPEAQVWTIDEEAADVYEWIAREPDVTGLIVWSETLGAMVVRNLGLAGVRVPADVSVVSFDGTELADYVYPTLTSARQPIREMATTAVKIIIQRLEGDASEWQSSLFPSVLHVGGSTGPAR